MQNGFFRGVSSPKVISPEPKDHHLKGRIVQPTGFSETSYVHSIGGRRCCLDSTSIPSRHWDSRSSSWDSCCCSSLYCTLPSQIVQPTAVPIVHHPGWASSCSSLVSLSSLSESFWLSSLEA